MNPTDTSDARDMLLNPYCAVTFADYLFKDGYDVIVKEDWVKANTIFIQDSGKEQWLKQLLSNLTTESTNDLGKMAMNPLHAVVISKDFQGEHEPIVTEQAWLAANNKLMDELGPDAWLWALLNILETGSSRP
jgi:hypothetical protein